MVPVHLLIYAVQTGVTTLTCVMDYVSWDVPMKVKVDLGGLYGPYLALSMIMGVDMFVRLRGVMKGKVKTG